MRLDKYLGIRQELEKLIANFDIVPSSIPIELDNNKQSKNINLNNDLYTYSEDYANNILKLIETIKNNLSVMLTDSNNRLGDDIPKLECLAYDQDKISYIDIACVVSEYLDYINNNLELVTTKKVR